MFRRTIRTVLRSSAAVAATAALALAVAAPAASAAPAGCTSQTYSMQYYWAFAPGHFCDSSPDGTYWATFQTDGNFVLYSAHGGVHAVWSSHTAGRGKELNFQSDGNVVVYAAAGPRGPLWNSGTSGHYTDSLVVQSDGNMVIYQQSGANRFAVWATNTVHR